MLSLNEKFKTVEVKNLKNITGGRETGGGSHDYGNGKMATWSSDSDSSGTWCYDDLEYHNHGVIV